MADEGHGKGVEILITKITEKKHIRIIGDYDIDGVCSTYILTDGLETAGAVVSMDIPDRIKDGYGINEHLIDKAWQDGVDTIVTCDNGIAAIEQIAYAKELGMTVIVTDHHEIPYEETEQGHRFLRVNADATINPKQPDCVYPYKLLCGGAVAYKLIQALYARLGPDSRSGWHNSGKIYRICGDCNHRGCGRPDRGKPDSCKTRVESDCRNG